MLNLKAAGVLDVRIIAGWMNRITLSFIARVKPSKFPADLKGKRIAISRFGASSDFVTRMLLRYWKLDPEKDVAIIQSGGNDAIRIAALVAGHIDGALIGTYDLPKILDSRLLRQSCRPGRSSHQIRALWRDCAGSVAQGAARDISQVLRSADRRYLRI